MSSKVDFETFLSNIRPTKNQKDELRDGHLGLREKLKADPDLSPILVGDFLQGSYRRATALRPKGNQEPTDASDVDIVVATNLDEASNTPEQAIDRFIPFCKKHYKDQWRRQGRSIGIELDEIKMDLVITSTTSEAQKGALEALSQSDDLESVYLWTKSRISAGLDQPKLYEFLRSSAATDWNSKPLRIPDRDAGQWVSTHPLDQIHRTWDKSKSTDGHFVNAVKALKWWRMEQNDDEPEHPKSYPLERLVFNACPDGKSSVAECVVLTFEAIRDSHAPIQYSTGKPVLWDLGLQAHSISLDVFSSVTASQYKSLYSQADEAATIARRAFEAEGRSEQRRLWRQLLGDAYPDPSEVEDDDGSPGKGSGGYTFRTEQTINPGGGRFA